jgi:hypothetical protein
MLEPNIEVQGRFGAQFDELASRTLILLQGITESALMFPNKPRTRSSSPSNNRMLALTQAFYVEHTLVAGAWIARYVSDRDGGRELCQLR